MTRSEAIDTLKQLLADSERCDQDGVEEIPFDYKDRNALRLILQEIDHAPRNRQAQGRLPDHHDALESREENGPQRGDVPG